MNLVAQPREGGCDRHVMRIGVIPQLAVKMAAHDGGRPPALRDDAHVSVFWEKVLQGDVHFIDERHLRNLMTMTTLRTSIFCPRVECY